MFLCDYHTHTYYSFDGNIESTPDALCLAAIEKGITHLAITDHFETNAVIEKYSDPYKACDAYNEMYLAKEKYKDKLNVAIGIELGQGHQYPTETAKLFDTCNYDFVIGSLHNLRSCPDFAHIKMGELPDTYIGYLFERYMGELTEMIRTVPQIDTIGHITYMHRYIALCGKEYDFVTNHKELLVSFFEEIVSRGIALEVNVSTLWKGLGFSMPNRDILSLYKECKGELITVGTDAHHPRNVGRCVTDGLELLKNTGFNYVMAIENRKKKLFKI